MLCIFWRNVNVKNQNLPFRIDKSWVMDLWLPQKGILTKLRTYA